MRKASLVALAVLALSGASRVEAQQSATATLNVGDVLSLSLSSSTVSFPSPTATEFNSGFVAASSGLTVTGKANVAYAVSWSASGTGSNLTAGTYNSKTGRNSKPLSHLLYSTSGALTNAASGSAVPTSSTSLATGAAGATTTTPVYFGMVLDWADTPGSYSATLTYTMAAQ